MPGATTETLLQWYDTAHLLDVKKGVRCVLDGEEQFLTYTYEGAQYLSEQNPKYNDGKRECVVYKGRGLP